LNLNDRLRLVKALEEHRGCLEREAKEDTRDPDFSCGRLAANELRARGLSDVQAQSIADEINSRAVEIWELEELIQKVKEERS